MSGQTIGLPINILLRFLFDQTCCSKYITDPILALLCVISGFINNVPVNKITSHFTKMCKLKGRFMSLKLFVVSLRLLI